VTKSENTLQTLSSRDNTETTNEEEISIISKKGISSNNKNLPYWQTMES
jgi:hypothetical protein